MLINKYEIHAPNILVKENGRRYPVSEMDMPEKIVTMVNTLYNLNKRAVECLYLVALNTKCKCLGTFEVSRGTAASTYMNPREILLRSLLVGASGIVLLHNHPSGDARPSQEDIEATKRVLQASKLMGIDLLDHIVVAGNGFYSFRERGNFNESEAE